MCVASGEYMESEIMYIGIKNILILQNKYGSGETIKLRYRHGATEGDCLAAEWSDYAGMFDCLGYVQVRVEYLT